MLVRLCMLEIRLRNLYLSGLEDDWTKRFDVEVLLYERLVARGSWHVAKSTTQDDQFAFRGLSLSSLVNDEHCFRKVKSRWNNMCFKVQECAAPETGLQSFLVELAQVRLCPL